MARNGAPKEREKAEQVVKEAVEYTIEQNIRPYKFIVQAVVQEVDPDGNVITEHAAEPVQIFGCDQLAVWAEEFPENLKNAKQSPQPQPVS